MTTWSASDLFDSLKHIKLGGNTCLYTLEKCEELFGFDNLKGYGSTRMYGFLGERFMSYWFQKNTKYTTMPVTFFDINQEN